MPILHTRKLLAAIAVSVLSAGTAHAADLTVEVRNVTKTSGRIFVALFDRAEGFPRKGYVRGEAQPPNGPITIVTFRNVPDKTYAVTAYHDVDGNGKLNTNGLGIPIEPLAFSNDAAAALDGPPKFSDASFKMGGPAMKITLTLK